MSESILEEAQRLTHGPRRADYGHPLDDYGRTAAIVSAMLAHKLKSPLTAHEMALAMCCVKLSREMNAQKRDNMTDLAGYAWVAHACLEESQRREAQKITDDVMIFGTGVGHRTSNGIKHVPLSDQMVGQVVDEIVELLHSDSPCGSIDDGAFPLHPEDKPLPTSRPLGDRLHLQGGF